MLAVGFFENILAQLNKTLIVENRYQLYLDGIFNTVLIALGAIALGTIIGVFFAMITYINKKTGTLKVANKIVSFLIYVLRGTPVMLQLLIMYLIVLASAKSAVFVAIITFGINSSAYVAELFRGGLESVDIGQFEASRSLGLGLKPTMTAIIVPQGFRTALPSLFNEFIALVKETSIVGVISVVDITQAAKFISSRTFDAFFPLIISALIYLALVALLTIVLRKIERRMAVSDRSN